MVTFFSFRHADGGKTQCLLCRGQLLEGYAEDKTPLATHWCVHDDGSAPCLATRKYGGL